jgi:hypothetical protein
MIPYEELDRALARWKARTHGGTATDAAPPVAEPDTLMPEMEAEPEPDHQSNGLSHSDQAGEINLEEEVIETYDEN